MSKDRWLYFVCVACAIVLVTVGWVMTIRQTVAEGFTAAKERISEMQTQLHYEFEEAQRVKGQTSSIKQSIDLFLLKRQIIQTLKTRIETEAYATKEEPVTTQ